jgi:outer membrane protein
LTPVKRVLERGRGVSLRAALRRSIDLGHPALSNDTGEISMTKLLGLAAIVLAIAAPAAQAGDDNGAWLVRGRALHLKSANGDSTGLGLSINDKTFPELDISYFLTPNLAAELVLTYPQEHTLYANGSKIATLKHLPPTLSLQYHVTGLGALRPYAGLGINFTNFSDVRFEPAVVTALQPSIKRNSTGGSIQIGADFALGGGWVLNADLKKVQLKTDVYSGSAKAGTFKVDPTLFSLGAGLRF